MTRRRAIRTIVELVVFDLIIGALVSLVSSFPIMLALGALHSQWSQIPAFGWWATYLIVLAWYWAMSTTRTLCFDNASARIRIHKLS